MPASRPPLPPFTERSARQKVQAAEDAWNTRDPDRVVLAYTLDSRWRNRSEFLTGRDEIHAFLVRKWQRELDYALRKDLWASAMIASPCASSTNGMTARPVVALLRQRELGVRRARPDAAAGGVHQRRRDRRRGPAHSRPESARRRGRDPSALRNWFQESRAWSGVAAGLPAIRDLRTPCDVLTLTQSEPLRCAG